MDIKKLFLFLAIFIVVAAPTVAINSTELFIGYNFTDTTGTTVIDIAGNYNATCTNMGASCVTNPNGRVGDSMVFNADGNDYLSVPYNFDMGYGTICFGFNITITPNEDYFFGFDNADDLWVRIRNTPEIKSKHGTGVVSYGDSAYYGDGNHDFCITFDKDTASNNAFIVDNSTLATTSAHGSNITDAYDFAIGARTITGTPDANFIGNMDYFYVFDKVLSATELEELYEDGLEIVGGSSPPADPKVHILGITANGVTFVNGTEFNTTNDVVFNVSYEVNDTDSGDILNHTVWTYNDLANSPPSYYIDFEVCYGAVCNSSGNYTYTVDYTPPPTLYTFYISAVDAWDGSAITNFNVTGLNGTLSDGGTGTVNFSTYDSTVNFTYSKSNYLSRLVTGHDTSSNASYGLGQANLTFAAFELVSNDSVSNVNYTVGDGTTKKVFADNESTLLTVGSYWVYAEPSGYYGKNVSFSVAALQTGYVEVEGVYSAYLNVTFVDALTGAPISVATNLTVNGTGGYSETYSNATGLFWLPIVQDSFTLIVQASDYATITESVTVDEDPEAVVIDMYAKNNLWVTALDFNSGASLANFSVSLYNDLNVYSFDDGGNGTAMQNNITSGVYTARVSKTGYTANEYTVTVAANSHSDLIAYLVADGGDTTIFTVKDSITGQSLENLTVSMYKAINATWTLVNSQQTDITGRVRISYTSDIEYKFIVSGIGYETKTFYLEPLFGTYTIIVVPSVTEQADVHTGGYSVNVGPITFYDEDNNNLTFDIASGSGSIEYYNVTILAPNVNESGDFSSALGGTHVFNFNISGAVIGDTVLVSYGVKEVGKNYKTYIKAFPIVNDYNTTTFFDWEDGSSSFGDFEKSLIATFILLVIVGVVASGSALMGVNPFLPSAMTLIVFLGLFAVVGFVPMWSLYISGFSLLLIVLFTARSGV